MSQENRQDLHHHLIPLKVYFGVFGALLVLTGLTVVVSQLNLGMFAIYAAMMISLVMGGLVVGYFMHLKFEAKFHQLIFFGSLFFMVVFFSFVFLDLSNRAQIVPEQGNFALSRDRQNLALMGAREKAADAEVALGKRLGLGVTDAELAAGQELYKQRCLSCHGPKGRGDGTAGAAFNPRPRDYADLVWQKRVSHLRIAKVILKGGIGMDMSPTMPPHPDLEKQIVGLVATVRGFAGIEMKRRVLPPASAAKPATPAAKSATPAAKSATPAAKSATPAAKSATPAAKSATPAAKSATPAAKSATPAAKSATPAAKPAPAPAK